MNRTGRFLLGQSFTAGEKALAVMLVAGFFGYWAGFSLSAPGVAAAASLPVAEESSRTAISPVAAPAPQVGQAWLVIDAPQAAVVRDDPPIPTF